MTNTRRITKSQFPSYAPDPFYIGFDKMLSKLQSVTPGQTNYPPYNIIKSDDYNYELQVAIAGFNQDDIEIELKDGVLSIEGKKSDDEDETKYLHKGISARAFRRTFTLADTIVVKGADLIDGILTVELENVIPEEKKATKIAIGGTRKKQELLKG